MLVRMSLERVLMGHCLCLGRIGICECEVYSNVFKSVGASGV